MSLIIRKATADDIPAIHRLVRQLAEFEKAPEEVLTTPQSFLDDFQAGTFDAFVAESDINIIGIAVFYYAFSTWKGRFIWLEDFIVEHTYRTAGVGRSLFDAVVEECKRQNLPQLKWQVLDWNEPAIRFYEKYESEFQREWLTYRIMLK